MIAKPMGLKEPAQVFVNGRYYTFQNGILEGFIETVREIDYLIEQNHELCDKNDSLISRLNKLLKRG